MRYRHRPDIARLREDALRAADFEASRLAAIATKSLGPVYQIKAIEAQSVLAGSDAATPMIDGECARCRKSRHALAEEIAAEAAATTEQLVAVETGRQRAKAKIDRLAAARDATGLRRIRQAMLPDSTFSRAGPIGEDER